jgi:hypothetical protein
VNLNDFRNSPWVALSYLLAYMGIQLSNPENATTGQLTSPRRICRFVCQAERYSWSENTACCGMDTLYRILSLLRPSIRYALSVGALQKVVQAWLTSSVVLHSALFRASGVLASIA